MGLELLFWLVPQFIVSAIAVSFVGFFLGPLFPATVIAATKLLPKHLHVSAIGSLQRLEVVGLPCKLWRVRRVVHQPLRARS
jgi:fucose permease